MMVVHRFLHVDRQQVGPDACALSEAKGENPTDIESRIESFVDGLYYTPLDVPGIQNPGLLTSGRVRSM